MPQGSIQRELSLGEVISQTFDLYRRHFTKYVTIYLVLEAIIGALDAVVFFYIVLQPAPGPGATQQQLLNWLSSFLPALIALIFLLVLVTAIFGTIAAGATIKISSEFIENRPPELGASVKFTFSKLLSIWAVSIITFMLILLGAIALVIPGIILGIMFSLTIPALLIENIGVFESMGRSRRLVSGRWLKSLAVYIVIGIIVAILSSIASLIVSPIGNATVQTIVSSLLSAFYAPLVPILLTVYYYSNAARIGAPTTPQPSSTFTPAFTSAAGFCPSCGEPITEPNQAFCKKCGANLRPR